MTIGYRYKAYGLVVESDICFVSVPEDRDNGEAADIEIATAPPDYFVQFATALTHDPDEWVQHVVLPDGRVYMNAANVFEALISSDGRKAACRRIGDVDARSFEANLMNYVVSTSLTLRGEEPLHSTVVEVGGRAVGLLGMSGAGKSTLAAYLISQGADLITDDMLRIEFAGDLLLAFPGPYRLKLFEEPGSRFLPEALTRGHFNPLSGKTMMQPRRQVPLKETSVPLCALFHLNDTDGSPAIDRISAVRLFGADLGRVLVSSAMDDRLADPERLSRQIRFAALVATRLPVYALRYPRRFDVFDEVAETIRRTITS